MSKTSCCSQPCDSTLNKQSQWLKIAFILVILTILYNIAESFLAVFSGYASESVALMGFGLDSLLEVSAAVLILRRLIEQIRCGSDKALEETETRVHRFVGGTFILLAAYIGYNAVLDLVHQSRPAATMLGIVLAAISLTVMPLFAWGKMRAAKEIKSPALYLEAKESVACSILALILLLGLALNSLFGWWWADPVAALTMTPWLLKEGIAGLKGEGCCG